MSRVTTAFILLFILGSVFIFATPFYFFVFTTALILLTLNEFFDLIEKGGRSGYKKSGIILGGLFPLAVFFNLPIASILTLIFFSLLLIVIFSPDKRSSGLEGVAYSFLGIIYVGWLMSHLILVRNLSHGRDLILVCFLITSFSDILAYYTGKSLGKTLLVPDISPKKTVEGSLAGLGGSLLAVLFGNFFFHLEIPLPYQIILGFLAGIFAQLGDLAESLFKRNLGVKDSGTILPGHGGLLDRFDSILFTLPVVYYFMVLVG